jgi:MYXO-CTERM domain-containing protein
MVCEMGVCMETCHCRMCPAGQECDLTTGACVNAGCIGIPCPAGQACQGGVCIDACTNVVCPGGAACTDGWCGEPIPGVVGPTDGGSSNPIDPIYIEDGGTATGEDTGPPPGFLDLCSDTCPTTPGAANNGVCEDGGQGSVSALCPHGTDCTDCGTPRNSVDTLCTDDCVTAGNGQCEDGAPLSVSAACALGTDCTDCGPRWDGTDTPVPQSAAPSNAGTAPADPGCSCRSANRGRSTPLGSLLLFALGLAGLRRTARRIRAG